MRLILSRVLQVFRAHACRPPPLKSDSTNSLLSCAVSSCVLVNENKQAKNPSLTRIFSLQNHSLVFGKPLRGSCIVRRSRGGTRKDFKFCFSFGSTAWPRNQRRDPLNQKKLQRKHTQSPNTNQFILWPTVFRVPRKKSGENLWSKTFHFLFCSACRFSRPVHRKSSLVQGWGTCSGLGLETRPSYDTTAFLSQETSLHDVDLIHAVPVLVPRTSSWYARERYSVAGKTDSFSPWALNMAAFHVYRRRTLRLALRWTVILLRI